MSNADRSILDILRKQIKCPAKVAAFFGILLGGIVISDWNTHNQNPFQVYPAN